MTLIDPQLRWKSLRATEGWAALQHHAVLQSTITITPPPSIDTEAPPRLRVDLVQGSYFAIIPTGAQDPKFVPEWHTGNIYAMERALARSISLPTPPSLNTPTVYNIFVAGDYEVRRVFLKIMVLISI